MVNRSPSVISQLVNIHSIPGLSGTVRNNHRDTEALLESMKLQGGAVRMNIRTVQHS
jgi:hypothetical protein